MTEKRIALIIASYQYEDKGLRRLIAPAHDAEALASVLEDPAIGGFDVQTLLNESSYKVRQEIETFFMDRKREDLLLLYFSGHGIKDEDGKLYFSTTDTKRKLLRATAIEANFVNDVMQRSRSRKQVLLLDCCYSGAFARGMVAKADKNIGTREHFQGQGRVILTASDSMQYSFEGDHVEGKSEPSVFTNSLVHGLKSGEADRDGDGRITLDELYDYVHDRVTDTKPEQRPTKWDFGVKGKIVIARNPNPVVKPVELPTELHESIKDLRPWVREGAVHELGRLLQGNNKGLALSAHEALKRMKGDDSQKVKAEVDRILEKYDNVQSTKKSEPVVKPVAFEKEDTTPINTEESEVGQLEQERQESRIREGATQIPPIKKEPATTQSPVKRSKLIWLLPSILVPFIGGMAVLGIYLSNSQKSVTTEEIIKPESIETVKEPSVPEEEVFEKPDTPEDSLSEKTEDSKPSTKTMKPEPIVNETVREPDVPEREIIEQQAITKTRFRSKPKELPTDTVKSMLKDKGFFDAYRNKSATGFTNNYEVKHNGEVVFDSASGLMWQQSGSDEYMTYENAKAYVAQLHYAGYSDWRLPTLEEAMSLMEPMKNSDDLYIDSLFDSKQKWIWTSDQYGASSAWVAGFSYGGCNFSDFYYYVNDPTYFYVRAVR